MLDLEPIKERLAAATPGPWFHRQVGGKFDWIADHRDHGQHRKIIVGKDALYGGTPDYAFIAHAPNDIALLMAEVERLRSDVQNAFDMGYRAAGGTITPIPARIIAK